MKKIKFILILLFFGVCEAQTNGCAIYDKEWINLFSDSAEGRKLKNNDPKTYQEYKEIEQEQTELTKELKYILEFTHKESLFFLEEIMDKDNSPSLQLAAGPFQGVYYQNIETHKNIWQLDSYDGRYLIKLDKKNWKLEKEKKLIYGYTCYKATIRNNDEIVEAWYTPEIPLNYGPMGYNGLPGMILGLTVRGEKFTIKELNFTKNTQKIKVPHQGKKITFQEFQQKFKK